MCARCVHVGYGGSIPQDKAPLLSSGVVSISSTAGAHAAIKNDGSVVAWGDVFGARHGGGPAQGSFLLMGPIPSSAS